MNDERNKEQERAENLPHGEETTTGRQEQSDPQLTELKGFIDPKEDLEPTLTDGTKVPDKANEENQKHGWKKNQ